MPSLIKPAPVCAGDQICDATVWRRADYPDDRSWVPPVPAALVRDLKAALPRLRELDLHPSEIRAAHCPLRNSQSFISEIRQAVECGPGFALISDFPIDDFAEADLRLVYCALAAHFGNITIQSRAEEYIVDVSDKGRPIGAGARGHYGRDRLPFHVDGANIVTLLCMDTGAMGGESLLVSGAAVYNAVVENHPEYLPILLRGFHHHRREERAPGDAPVTPWRTPVFAFYDNVFHMIYMRASIDWCEPEGTVISAEEKAALDYVDSIIAQPEMQVSMVLRPGDLQLVNNFLVLHGRTAYSDSSDHRRRLIRLWLDAPEGLRNGPGKMDWYMPNHSRFLKTRGHLLEGYSLVG